MDNSGDHSLSAGQASLAGRYATALFGLARDEKQIDSVSASRLGNATDGYLTDIINGGNASLVAGKAAQASSIIDSAISQVAVIRGRLGAFQKNTLETNINSLNVTLENITSSESNIRDTDFAKETANLTRAQILVQAGTSVLAQANSTPQSVLSLLKA